MFCNKCGAQISDNAEACSSCGEVIPRQPSLSTKLHCPKCKSHNLTVTTESSVEGAITAHSSYTGVSSTKVESIHRNFWVCSDCGTKFRNIQNLEEEIAHAKKKPKAFGIIAAIFFAIAIFFIINLIRKPWAIIIFGAATGFFLLIALISFVLMFSAKGKVKKLWEELEYLNTNCFN